MFVPISGVYNEMCHSKRNDAHSANQMCTKFAINTFARDQFENTFEMFGCLFVCLQEYNSISSTKKETKGRRFKKQRIMIALNKGLLRIWNVYMCL